MKHLFNFLLLFVLIVSCSTQKNTQTSETEAAIVTDYTTDPTDRSKNKNQEGKEAQIISAEPINHIVEKGESLWVIAQKYGVTLQGIEDANDIVNASLIKIGQELVIPVEK